VRHQPTSATVKEHGHTDWTARSSRGTRCFGAFRRPGVSRDLRTARPPKLTPRAPEGKVATGRQDHESACTTGAQRPTRGTTEHLIVARCTLLRDLVVPRPRGASLRPDFDPPRER
jgi:hypothetical protein